MALLTRLNEAPLSGQHEEVSAQGGPGTADSATNRAVDDARARCLACLRVEYFADTVPSSVTAVSDVVLG